MKRHPALEQLSRDHHRALSVAQRLKRADDATRDEARSAFLEHWDAEGREHFREEEELLLPAVLGFIDPEEPLIARVLVDHVKIRHMVSELGDAPEPDALHALGRELEQHVRREDRELFPLIEESMPEHELVALAQRLEPGGDARAGGAW